MDIFEAIEKRRTIRKYQGVATEEQLNRIITAATKSPSGQNKQNWEFVIVDDQTLIDKVSEIKYLLNRKDIPEYKTAGRESIGGPGKGRAKTEGLFCKCQSGIGLLQFEAFRFSRGLVLHRKYAACCRCRGPRNTDRPFQGRFGKRDKQAYECSRRGGPRRCYLRWCAGRSAKTTKS